MANSNAFCLYSVSVLFETIFICKIIFKEENISAKLTFFKCFFGDNFLFIYMLEWGLHYFNHLEYLYAV